MERSQRVCETLKFMDKTLHHWPLSAVKYLHTSGKKPFLNEELSQEKKPFNTEFFLKSSFKIRCNSTTIVKVFLFSHYPSISFPFEK